MTSGATRPDGERSSTRGRIGGSLQLQPRETEVRDFLVRAKFPIDFSPLLLSVKPVIHQNCITTQRQSIPSVIIQRTSFLLYIKTQKEQRKIE